MRYCDMSIALPQSISFAVMVPIAVATILCTDRRDDPLLAATTGPRPAAYMQPTII